MSKQPIGIGSKTVYPIKSVDQIKSLERYLLDKALDATTASKKRLAYRNFLYVALGINVGFRGGDLTELTWGQLATFTPSGITFRDEEWNYIHAEKTGKLHLIVLNEEARSVIRFYYKQTKSLGTDFSPEAPVFFSNKTSGTSEATVTGHVDVDNIGRTLKAAAKAVGIQQNVCSHTLRKTFGYHYFKETGDLATLQKIFGHSSSAITLTYIGLDAETITAAYNKKPNTSIDFEAYLNGTEEDDSNVLKFPNAI